MSGHSTDEIKAGVRRYIAVFVALAALTVVTVAVSYLNVSTAAAIGIALFIASIKGGLVAGYFMHLFDEAKLIYSVLALTVVFFAVIMTIPTFWHVTLWVTR